ncbi:zinc-binding dehydrogenase [Streptomyces sp. NPDC094149]
MAMPAEGRLRMKSRRTMPMREAAEAHRLLESGGVRERIILSVG